MGKSKYSESDSDSDSDTELSSGYEDPKGKRKMVQRNKRTRNKGGKGQKTVSKEPESQCRPDLVISLLEELSDDKKQALHDIGFGALFEMKITEFGRSLIGPLCERYNGYAHWFKVRGDLGFHVSNDDVYDFFKLPNNESNPVEEIATGMCSQYDDDRYKFAFRAKMGVGSRDPVPLKTVRDYMLKDECSVSEFKQLAVLYLFGVFFNPTSNRTVDVSLLKAVDDVEKIGDKAWGPYVRTKMGQAVENHKRHHTQSVGGCIALMELIYFHRVQFDGELQDTSLPLISHWTDEKLEFRSNCEMFAGELGLGHLDTETYPVSKKMRVQNSNGHPVSASLVQAENSIRIPLYPGLPSDVDIIRAAVNDEHKTLLQFKRDTDALNQFYGEQISSLKAKLNGNRDSEIVKTAADLAANVEPDYQNMPYTQFLGQECVVKWLDRVEREYYAMKKAAADFPSFELLSQPLSGDYCRLGASSSGLNGAGGAFDEIVQVAQQNVQLSDGLDNLDCSDVIGSRPRSLNALQMERAFNMVTGTGFLTKGTRTNACKPANAPKAPFTDLSNLGVVQRSAPNSDILKVPLQPNGANDVQCDENLANAAGNVVSAPNSAILKPAEQSNVVQNGQNTSDQILANSAGNGGSKSNSQILRSVLRSSTTENVPNSAVKGGFAPSSGILKVIQRSNAAQDAETSGAAEVSIFRSPLRFVLPATVKSDGLGCTLDCGSAYTLAEPVSALMKGNQPLLDYMPCLRKITCDYCFVEDGLTNEQIVCSGNGQVLVRQDLLTLYPSKNVSRKVVESWALLMNYLEWDERIYPHRFFFGLTHMDNFTKLGCCPNDSKSNVRKDFVSNLDSWLLINSHHYDLMLADLVFVPLEFENNYFTLVINFVAQRFDLLDHHIYSKEDDDCLKSMADRLRKEMVLYFKKKEHPRSKELAEFKLYNFPLSWMVKRIPKCESAVYLMVHMLNYQGEEFQSDLSNPRSRRMYRAEIAVALALSDFNSVRTELLSKVDRLHKKPTEDIIEKARRYTDSFAAACKRSRTELVPGNQNLARNQPPQRHSPRLLLSDEAAAAAELADFPARNVIKIRTGGGSNARRMSPRVVPCLE